MYKTCKDIKADARQSLLGYYRVPIASAVAVGLITMLLNIPFNQMMSNGMYYGSGFRVLIGIVGSLIISLLSCLLDAGLCRIHLQIARRHTTNIRDVLYPFLNQPNRYLAFGALQIVLGLVCELPGMLLLAVASAWLTLESGSGMLLLLIGAAVWLAGSIVLIIVELSWSMTSYLFLDDISLTCREAIRRSRYMMSGNKGRLFKLTLSFIGIALLGLLSFGIGLLWVAAYLRHSRVWFYLDLTDTSRR